MTRLATVLTVGAMLLAFLGGVALAREIACTSNPCVGTDKEDTISGSSAEETIRAKGGGDTVISNQGGDDTVEGGSGNDSIDVSDGAGGDFVDCGKGRDDTVAKDPGDTDERCEDTGPVTG